LNGGVKVPNAGTQIRPAGALARKPHARWLFNTSQDIHAIQWPRTPTKAFTSVDLEGTLTRNADFRETQVEIQSWIKVAEKQRSEWSDSQGELLDSSSGDVAGDTTAKAHAIRLVQSCCSRPCCVSTETYGPGLTAESRNAQIVEAGWRRQAFPSA
jgi:hypothetical protein